MKEFEFDDIEISDEKDLIKEETSPKKEEDPLYQKFSFDIDIDSKEDNTLTEPETKEDSVNEIEPEIKEESFDEVNIEPKEEKNSSINDGFFETSNTEIDNPFLKVEKEEIEEKNIYEEGLKELDPIIDIDKEHENKEDALEEALSHTTKFTPFKEEKPEVDDVEIDEDKKEKNGVAYLIVLFVILLIAIFLIPKIASLL